MSKSTTALLTFIIVSAFVAIWIYGSGLSDQSDCLTWAQEADVYPAFYITPVEKEQCDYWHVQINAPIGTEATQH